MTSRTSAPTASHRLATALTKLSLVARKALEAYLIVSAVAASVTISGAWVRGEERADPGRRGLVVGPDHDPVGVEAVVDGRALAQELGVRHHRDVGAVEEPLDQQGRSHRDRRLVHDHGAVRRGGDRSRRPPHSRKVTSADAVGPLGGGHAQEHELGAVARRRRRRCTKRSRPDAEPLAQELLEAVLDDGGLAPRRAGSPWPGRTRRSTTRYRDGPGQTAVVSPT